MRQSTWLLGLFVVISACAATPGTGNNGDGGGDRPDADPNAPDADPFAPDADPSAPDADPSAPDAGPGCSGGRTRCGTECVDLATDEDHCGDCPVACDPGEYCGGGECLNGTTGLVLSEVNGHASGYIELYNGSGAPIDLAGHKVLWSIEGGQSGAVTLPSFVLASDAFVVLRGAPGEGELAMDPLTGFNEIAVNLLEPGGVGIDFVRTGASLAPPPTGTTWTGANAGNPSAAVNQSLTRNVYHNDTNTAADWTLTTPASPGRFCGLPDRCGDACPDLSGDQDNCGACGLRCLATQVCLAGVCTGAVGSLWMTEYRRWPRAGVELHNPSATPLDLGGYRLEVAGQTTLNYFFPAHVVQPGAYLMVYEGTGTDDEHAVFAGAAPTAFSANVAITLYDGASTPLDYLRVGSATTTPPLGAQWFGVNVASPSDVIDQSIRRDVRVLDSHSAEDWVMQSPSTPGYACNPGMSLCDGRCVALAEDRDSCGACGETCGAHETCSSGLCVGVGEVVISELRNQGGELFELYNGGAATVDLGGYVVDWVADFGSGSYVIPAGFMLPSGRFVVLQETSGTNTTGTLHMNTPIAWTAYIAVSLKAPGGSAIDFVKTGGSPSLPPAGTTWTGAAATNPSDTVIEFLRRDIYASDSDGAGDWAITTTVSPGQYCAAANAVTCSGECTILASSSADCGACGNVCPPGTVCTSGACDADGLLRLVTTTDPTRGRLEVFHAGQWGTVCDDGFTLIEAAVACRQLGLGNSGSSFTAGNGSGTIWMDDVNCVGPEARLVECAFLGFGNNNCSHGEDVGVDCTP
jgi:hypothetical protein